MLSGGGIESASANSQPLWGGAALQQVRREGEEATAQARREGGRTDDVQLRRDGFACSVSSERGHLTGVYFVLRRPSFLRLKRPIPYDGEGKCPIKENSSRRRFSVFIGNIGFAGVIEPEDGVRGRTALRAQRLGGRERSLAASSALGWEFTV